MADPAEPLRQGRRLRDAARALVKSDLEIARDSVSSRASSVVGEGKRKLWEHRAALGLVAGLSVAGLAAVLLRKPLTTGLREVLKHAATYAKARRNSRPSRAGEQGRNP